MLKNYIGWILFFKVNVTGGVWSGVNWKGFFVFTTPKLEAFFLSGMLNSAEADKPAPTLVR